MSGIWVGSGHGGEVQISSGTWGGVEAAVPRSAQLSSARLTSVLPEGSWAGAWAAWAAGPSRCSWAPVDRSRGDRAGSPAQTAPRWSRPETCNTQAASWNTSWNSTGGQHMVYSPVILLMETLYLWAQLSPLIQRYRQLESVYSLSTLYWYPVSWGCLSAHSTLYIHLMRFTVIHRIPHLLNM